MEALGALVREWERVRVVVQGSAEDLAVRGQGEADLLEWANRSKGLTVRRCWRQSHRWDQLARPRHIRPADMGRSGSKSAAARSDHWSSPDHCG